MTYEYEGKTEKEAIELAANELGLERDQFDVEILETQKNSLFKKGYVKIRVHTLESELPKSHLSDDVEEKHTRIYADPLPQDEFEQKLLAFIQEMIEKWVMTSKFQFLIAKIKKLELNLNHHILQF